MQPPRPPRVLDSQGQPVRLGRLVGQGGEGAVYEVEGRPDVVAKIYASIDRDRADKLRAVVQIRSDRLSRIAAWPTENLHLGSGKDPVGFVMPRVSGYHDIHLLYGPKTRLTTFPDARWPFLIHAAGNTARAFKVAHDLSLVVGDVNHGNLLVDQRATVKFIDCDSFQVTVGGRTFPCKVGVETHTPPELQGQDLSRTIRTPNHDAFGLAIVIFQLLFLGRHPYSGTYLGQGHMPIGRAIAEGRFVYGKHSAAVRMKAPPHTLSAAALPANIAELFERAFPVATTSTPQRPTAGEWVAAIEVLERNLKTCAVDPSHQYATTVAECPWCRIESGARLQLFNAVLIPIPTSPTKFDLAVVWSQIEAISAPGAAPVAPTVHSLPKPSSAAVEEGIQRRRWQASSGVIAAVATVLFVLALAGSLGNATGGFVFVALMLGGAAATVYRMAPKKVWRDATGRLAVAQGEVEQLRHRLRVEAGEQALLAKKAELRRIRDEYLGLEKRRMQMLGQMSSQAEQIQRSKFLERHRIWQSRISGIGPERAAMLQSYGIETAADITAAGVSAVPGFGPVLTSNLISWRQGIERRFQFDPRKATDPSLIHKVEQQVASERIKLEKQLLAGPEQLRLANQKLVADQTHLRSALSDALVRQRQAEADLAALH